MSSTRPSACLLLALALGCFGSGDAPPEVCLRFVATPDLQLYDGQPHALRVLVFPLGSRRELGEAEVEDFLSGEPRADVLARPFELVVAPGERPASFARELPRGTVQLAVVADYYRPAGEAGGRRLVTLDPGCGFFERRVMLTASEVQLR